MKILKYYFFNNSIVLLFLPIIVLIVAFTIHYTFIMNYLEDTFKYTNTIVKNEILDEEKTIFKMNLLGNTVIYIAQLIGVILCLNIGLLMFGYKFSFKKLCKTIVKSSIILTIIYLIIPIILYLNQSVYSFKSLYNIESNYTLLPLADNFTKTWLKRFLEMFSISQVFFLLLLSFGMSQLMHWTYRKALKKTSIIYVIGFLIWACFSITMDINFYQ
ncbi:MAG: hypothetical protein R2816_10840 [Flavobacteriaceae bacterium]